MDRRGIDRRAYEGDIVSRLRHWRGLHLAHGGELFEAAADEIERLRERERYNAEAVVPERSKGGMAGCSPVESDASHLPCPRRGDTGVAAGSNPADSNHDAVPEACDQQSTRLSERSLLARSEAVERGLSRTGNTPSEAEIDAIECVVEDGRIASMSVYGVMRSLLVRLRPEWESQSYEEGDEKRMNTNTNRDATHSEGSVHPTLTDEERAAIEWYAGYGRDGLHADTLRKLLERTT